MALWHKGDNFTSDIVVISGHDAQRNLLLIRRKHPPFQDYWALPGGFVNSLTPQGQAFEFAETHRQAAMRELQEETGVIAQQTDLQLIGTYDAWGRDPRAEGDQRVITQTFLYLANPAPKTQAADDAADVQWFALAAVLSGEVTLAFDHLNMIRDAHAYTLRCYL